MKKEIWKNIKNYPDYQISNFGRVKSFKASTPRILKGSAKPYLSVVLCNNGKLKTYRAHVLVATYFVAGKTKKRNQVNHKDGNKLNNHYKNVEWVTAKENSTHRTKVLGKRFSNLSCEQVLKIRKEYPNKTYQKIADDYNVSKATIHRIIKRIYWRHI